MGCSQSRLDDEEAVRLCKDRKRFIKQAVEQRSRFASRHIDYINSLKRVSTALRDYIEGDEPREFTLDSYITPKSTPGFISITPKSFSLPQIQPNNPNSSFKVNYMRSGGNAAFSVEQTVEPPETYRVDAYSPTPNYGFDGFFAMPSSSSSPPVNSSVFGLGFGYSPNNRTSFIPPPSSPRSSQWDFFWNPFSSLDYYRYPNRSSFDQTAIDEDIIGLKQVREEEGIPDLEEDVIEHEESLNVTKERPRNLHSHCCREEVTVEDVVDDDDDGDNDGDDDSDDETDGETDGEMETEHHSNVVRSQASTNIEVSRARKTVQVETSTKEMDVGRGDTKSETTPGFTVYVNRRPTNMTEVINDLDAQFKIVCNVASEVSVLLEARRAQFASTSSTDLTAMKMLNPVALFRSGSSRSSSSRFLGHSSSLKDNNGDESGSELSEDTCMFPGSHQSTLDRLYAWEKKLYDQVKSGEKIRIAYEKKCAQLRNQDVKGEDPSSVDKTRVGIRDLHTQIKVSIHSIEAISKRIETLRDEELQPQLLELVKGLARMWKVMAECHQKQKRTMDEAKLLLAGTPSKLDSRRHSSISVNDPQRLARSAVNLETELRNWKTCFESWITSQRSYVHALTGWLLRCCARSDPDISRVPFSPRRSNGTLPIFGFCIKWSRLVDDVREIPVLDGLDFFAAGMGSIYAQQMKDESRRVTIGSKRFGSGLSSESGENMELVEVGQVVEEVMTVEKMAEVAIRVLCAGMSVAMSSLTEFAIGSADGYEELNQWETTTGSARRVVM